MFWMFLDKYRDEGLLLLRVGLGIMFIVHGALKLAGGPPAWVYLGSSVGLTLAPAFWGFVAAMVETVGGLLLAVGLLFRVATILLILQMLAALTYHLRRGDPFDTGYSRPLEMIFVFLGLFFIGPGRYSLDEYLLRRSSPRHTPPAVPR